MYDNKYIKIYNALYMYNTARTLEHRLKANELLKQYRKEFGDKAINNVRLSWVR